MQDSVIKFPSWSKNTIIRQDFIKICNNKFRASCVLHELVKLAKKHEPKEIFYISEKQLIDNCIGAVSQNTFRDIINNILEPKGFIQTVRNKGETTGYSVDTDFIYETVDKLGDSSLTNVRKELEEQGYI